MKPHFFLLGICGSMMSGLALLLRAQGYRVSGCDKQQLPPLGDWMAAQKIECFSGYQAARLPAADCYVIGNSISRGNEMAERILREKRPYISAAALLRAQIAPERTVIAIAGTHGKTTVTALTAAMLRQAGTDPGWFIGGIPADSPPAHVGSGPFVLEADEYDTAFFDKSAKFLHYRPDCLLINNLEFDHADIYPDLAAIQSQFHRLLRTLPDKAQVLVPAEDEAIATVLKMGCWSQLHTLHWNEETERAAAAKNPSIGRWRLQQQAETSFTLLKDGVQIAELEWHLPGEYNRKNLLAALATAILAGADPQRAIQATATFKNVGRRFQRLLTAGGIELYEDFAHHPTAISACLLAAKQTLPEGGRLLAAVDLASNSMAGGHHLHSMEPVVVAADQIFWYGKSATETASVWGGDAFADSNEMAEALLHTVRSGDRLILFSNGHFGGLRQQLPLLLKQHFNTTEPD